MDKFDITEILKAKGIVPREAMPVEIATDSEADSDMEPPAQAPSPESASPPPMAMQRYLNSSPRTATNDLPEGGIKTEEDQRKLDLEQLRERKVRSPETTLTRHRDEICFRSDWMRNPARPGKRLQG
jgi:hypothetical protein